MGRTVSYVRMLVRRQCEYVMLIMRPPGLDFRMDLKTGSTLFGTSRIVDDLTRRWNASNPRLLISGRDRITGFDKVCDEQNCSVRLQVCREKNWFVDNLPFVQSSNREATECTICLLTFDDDSVVKRMPCRHEFCAACLDGWLLLYGGDCPLCRAHVGEHLEA